jgi:hypothetical protein
MFNYALVISVGGNNEQYKSYRLTQWDLFTMVSNHIQRHCCSNVCAVFAETDFYHFQLHSLVLYLTENLVSLLQVFLGFRRCVCYSFTTKLTSWSIELFKRNNGRSFGQEFPICKGTQGPITVYTQQITSELKSLSYTCRIISICPMYLSYRPILLWT